MTYEDNHVDALHNDTVDLQNEAKTCSPTRTLLAQLRSLAVPQFPRGPRVYFLRKGNEVKIGFTHRLSQRYVQLGGAKLELLGTVSGTTTTERMYHQRFAHLRVHGEWFRAESELLDAIASEGEPFEASEPTYKELAQAFVKKTREDLKPGNSRLISAQTNVGYWLNMLANGETPERLAGLDEAVGNLGRAIG